MRLYDHDVCDFCGDDCPTWTFPAETHLDGALHARSIVNWLACDECARCIQRDEWDKLARRSLASPMVRRLIERMGDDFAIAIAARLHGDFVRHRTGAAYQHRKAQ